MIHNITEEREKRNRRDSSLDYSFTEEELARLIDQVEERAFIHAPAHLKDRIFFQLDEERQKRKKRQLFSYRAKVLVGMAAALAVLFLVPADMAGTTETQQDSILESLFAETETDGMEGWEQEALERQRNIDEAWELYCREQERADERKQYFENMADRLRNREKWED